MSSPTGFRRSDGTPGFRRNYLVVGATPCVESLIDHVSPKRAEVKKLVYRQGCTQSNSFSTQLSGLLANGNVIGASIVTMGCDGLELNQIIQSVQHTGVSIQLVSLQQTGAVEKLQHEISCHIDMVLNSSGAARCEINWHEIVLGLKCGGSDYSNGIVTNPFLGQVVTRLIQLGARIVATEPAELIGLRDEIKRRCINDEVFRPIDEKIQDEEVRLRDSGSLSSIMVQGNFDGGLTTIEEKSSGSFAKFSSSKIVGALLVSECRIDKVGEDPGVYVQLGTHQEPQAMTLMASAGVQGVLFATGRGGVFTHPVAPMFSFCGNEDTCRKMPGLFDYEVKYTSLSSEDCVESAVERIAAWLSGELSIAENMRLESFDFFTA